MGNKICFKCDTLKSIDEFYSHKKMKDGHLNKCKECTRKDVHNYTMSKGINDDWIEKERLRNREKYKRLGYKDKQKNWDKDKPWKSKSSYKSQNKNLKLDKGFEAHHWNYNDEYLKDIFILSRSEHKKSHRFLTFNKELRIFQTIDNVLLNTKEKHQDYLLQKGVNFLHNQK